MAKNQDPLLPLESTPTPTSKTSDVEIDWIDWGRHYVADLLWRPPTRLILPFRADLEDLWTQLEPVFGRWVKEHGYSAKRIRPPRKSKAFDACPSLVEWVEQLNAHIAASGRRQVIRCYMDLFFRLKEEHYPPFCELVATHGEDMVFEAAFRKEVEIGLDAPWLAEEQARAREKQLSSGRLKGTREQHTAAQTRRDHWFALDDRLLQDPVTCNLSVEERAKRIHEQWKWRVGNYPDGKPRYASVGTIRNAIVGRKKQVRRRASRTP